MLEGVNNLTILHSKCQDFDAMDRIVSQHPDSIVDRIITLPLCAKPSVLWDLPLLSLE